MTYGVRDSIDKLRGGTICRRFCVAVTFDGNEGGTGGGLPEPIDWN